MATKQFAAFATCILLGLALKCYYLGKDVQRKEMLEVLAIAKTWKETAEQWQNTAETFEKTADRWCKLYLDCNSDRWDVTSDMQCMLFNYVRERHNAGFDTSEWGLDWHGRVVAYAEPQPLSFHNDWYAITPEPIQGLGIEPGRGVIKNNVFEFRGPKETGAR